MNALAKIIANQTAIRLEQVDATLDLLDAGCTIPFISRYRKEATGNLNEVQVATISDLYEKLKELQKRKDTILKTIDAQGKLTDSPAQAAVICAVSCGSSAMMGDAPQASSRLAQSLAVT